MVELSGVEREFLETGPVVSHLDLRITPGEFVSFLGPSGCGKSTLLRLIAGLDAPDAGSIRVEAGAQKGFVFQEAHLLPWRNVLENAMLPLELMRRPRSEAELAARAALDKVGLSDAILKYPSQLSGGMKMRVSVARALVSEPRLLLLDEPFAALDENTRFRLQEDLRQLWEKLGMTIIFVTHSASEAVFLSDRAIVFTKRPATVVMDRKLELPKERVSKLRLNPSYLAEVETISSALRSGESV